mmetsp:Transcript_101289/g.179993  ORF Transcript_101289/g.179993 Transcript_101289/m.179993 type:complete len:965 (-) Transcript_101289:74-2968(-)|eukprot:CAMPEP_0197626362 /NCGR_PEP_ID=MMETSP1338-20131121/5367_1 /TAXON_ID=43686 ORGANISM="Pelagodinium beii, Strain RCC1491" /NCGR_SAMPLE_ID=MMETSP1338 /ASSEMBLY_ACC=CAM_ASM_000754 /LENGTH=964 /DNA_ID=CAMNT_0043196901 /DNA_START=20 /DNA_END=2914 /DNA_ORIENTATION=+
MQGGTGHAGPLSHTGFQRNVNPDAARLLNLVDGQPETAVSQAPPRPVSFNASSPMSTRSKESSRRKKIVAPGTVPSAKSCWPGLAEVLDGTHGQLDATSPDFRSRQHANGMRQLAMTATHTTFGARAQAMASDEAFDFVDLLPVRSAASSSTNWMATTRGNETGPRASAVPPLPKWLRREIRKVSRNPSWMQTSVGSSEIGNSDIALIADALATSTGFPKVRPAQVQYFESRYVTGTVQASQRLNDVQAREIERQQILEAEERGKRLAQRLTTRWTQQQIEKEREEQERKERELLREREEKAQREAERKRQEEEAQKSAAAKAASLAAEAAEMERRKKEEAKKKQKEEEQQQDEPDSPVGDGRRTSVERVDFFRKTLTLNSTKNDRVDRISDLRKQKKATKDEFQDSDDENGPKLVRPPPDSPSGNTEFDQILRAFLRYDLDKSGQLDMKEVRAALTDCGIHATMPQEKRAVLGVLQAALKQGGLDFYDLVKVVPKLREAIVETKRKDLEDWYTRGLDENGVFQDSCIQPTMEAMGIALNNDEELVEVLTIFQPLWQPEEPKPPKRKQRKKKDDGEEKKDNDEKREEDEPLELTPFEKFETLYHLAQEKLTITRRDRERQLIEEHKLAEDQVEEFRADLVDLGGKFKKFDVDDSQQLDEAEVLDLLAACGANANGGLDDILLHDLIWRSKQMAKKVRKGETTTMPGDEIFTLEDQKPKSVGWKRAKSFARKKLGVGKEPLDLVLISEESLEVNFYEFLYLMKLVRQRELEGQIERLKGLFEYYDSSKSGRILMKDVTRIFRDLGLTPRSRQEQLEIKQILDEVDEDGDGSFDFKEFSMMVQRCQERLERLVRIDEERYAVSLGLSLPRCRELRKLFTDHKHPGRNAIFITELRNVMNTLQRWYTSDQLHVLFNEFVREDIGGIDARAFLRMMHAIEVAKTHGYLPPKKEVPSPSSKQFEEEETT